MALSTITADTGECSVSSAERWQSPSPRCSQITTSAFAHVTVNPNAVPADTSTTFYVRVPTEKEEPTVRVRVDSPAGLTVSRFAPVPGWTRHVERNQQQLITSATWSGGQIAPGEYLDFPFIARTPKGRGSAASGSPKRIDSVCRTRRRLPLSLWRVDQTAAPSAPDPQTSASTSPPGTLTESSSTGSATA